MEAHSEATEQRSRGNIVLSEKGGVKAAYILKKELFVGRILTGNFRRAEFGLNSHYLVTADCEKKIPEVSENNEMEYQGFDRNLMNLRFGFYSIRDNVKGAYVTKDNIIEKFEHLPVEGLCRATVQLIPYLGNAEYTIPFYFDIMDGYNVFVYCKILAIEKIKGDAIKQEIPGNGEDTDGNKTGNLDVYNSIKDYIEQSNSFDIDYFDFIRSNTDNILFKDRSGKRLTEIWNACGKALLKLVSVNTYNEHAAELENLVKFRGRKDYAEKIGMLRKLSPEPNDDTLLRAYSVMNIERHSSRDDRSPFLLAFWYRRTIEKNATAVFSILKEMRRYYEDEKNYTKEEHLHHSIEKSDMRKIARLIELGADVNKIHNSSFCDSSGMTPMMVAARHGRLEIARLLVKNGALVNEKGSQEGTALLTAVTYGNRELARFLLEQGAYSAVAGTIGETTVLKSIDNITPLHVAVLKDDIETADLLVSHLANLNAVTGEGEVPMNFAKNEKMISYLFAKGAVIKPESHPLHRAALYGNGKVMKILLAKDFDINSLNDSGETALHCAVAADNVEAVRVLLEHGCSVNVATGFQIFNIADPATNAVKRLDGGGGTPLHYLARYNLNEKIAKMLLDKRADASIKDFSGRTAVDILAMTNPPSPEYPYGWKSGYLNKNVDNNDVDYQKKVTRLTNMLRPGK
ncbi:MAG: ankyrin repeat domain-containing protein [Spirochaetes bacterium]|nr:ankyrin repeat domain-containing protein [Spirochaetota bacterium]